MPRGVTNSYVIWTEEMLAHLRARYPEEGPKPLMEKFGVTYQGVTKKARKLGLKYLHRKRDSGLARVGKSRGCQVKHTFFKTWSNNMAYIVGYIYADGCITYGRHSQLKLSCTQEDGDLVVAIRNEIGSTHPVKTRSEQRMKAGYLCKAKVEVDICSRPLVEDLINLHGLQPAKSRKDLPFPEVPEEYLPHFIRGYFDGDGLTSISKSGQTIVGFCGQKQFVTRLQEILVSKLEVKKNALRHHTEHCVAFTNSTLPDVRAIHDFLYPPGEYIYLIRRKQWFDKTFHEHLSRKKRIT